MGLFIYGVEKWWEYQSSLTIKKRVIYYVGRNKRGKIKRKKHIDIRYRYLKSRSPLLIDPEKKGFLHKKKKKKKEKYTPGWPPTLTDGGA